MIFSRSFYLIGLAGVPFLNDLADVDIKRGSRPGFPKSELFMRTMRRYVPYGVPFNQGGLLVDESTSLAKASAICCNAGLR